jgi:hypothetical protein
MPCKPTVIVRSAPDRMMPEPDSQFAPFDSAFRWWYEITGDARIKERLMVASAFEFYLPGKSGGLNRSMQRHLI